ncbi:MAG: ATP-binding protein [Oscillospiraceae bacterium]|nr:ATP-binding protein [Oscillospiraceae bacterium]
MYTAEQQEILKKVDAIVEQEGSQNKASKLIGISAGVLSAIKSGTYKGNVDRVFETISNYLNVKNAALQTYSETDYVNTFISSEVYDLIRICQVKGGLAVACGDAGIGKTKAARKYVQDNATSSVLVTVNPCLTSVKSLLKEVASRIGAAQEKSRDELWYAIVRKLSDGMVLIFDEAQHLTTKAIEVLRSFSDYFNDRGQTLGIIFIGNLETMSRMGSKRAEFAQISNRTKQTRMYTVSQITKEDIIKLFPLLSDPGKSAEVDFILKIAHTHQGLRGATNLFSNAYDNEDYSYAGLVAMAQHMEMDV